MNSYESSSVSPSEIFPASTTKINVENADQLTSRENRCNLPLTILKRSYAALAAALQKLESEGALQSVALRALIAKEHIVALNPFLPPREKLESEARCALYAALIAAINEARPAIKLELDRLQKIFSLGGDASGQAESYVDHYQGLRQAAEHALLAAQYNSNEFLRMIQNLGSCAQLAADVARFAPQATKELLRTLMTSLPRLPGLTPAAEAEFSRQVCAAIAQHPQLAEILRAN